MPYLSKISFVLYFILSGMAHLFLQILYTYFMADVFILIHKKQALWIQTRRKALQAALVDPDVTGVMDGCDRPLQ